MNLTVTVEPPVEPLTVAQVYDFLRWDAEIEQVGSPPEDVTVYPLEAMVRGHIRTARIMAEVATRRAFVQQTLRLSTNAWRGIELLRPPLIQLESVAYYNTAGVLTLLDPDDFYVTDDLVPKLRVYNRVVQGCSDLSRERDDAIRVTYIVGYPPVYNGDSPATVLDYVANVPQNFKDAMLIQVQLLCDRFDSGEKADLERSRDALLAINEVRRWV